MATWTTPRTWVTDEVPTAAIMNTHVRDNLVAVGPGPTLAGRVDAAGAITSGAGFTVVKNGTGDFTVTFSTAFSTAPIVTAGVIAAVNYVFTPSFGSISTTAFQILFFDNNTTPIDVVWVFMARPPSV